MSAIRWSIAQCNSRTILSTGAAIAIVLVVGTLFFPAVAEAHKPVFARNTGSSFAAATRISDPAVSWTIYAALEKPAQVAYYSFEAARDQRLYAQVLVPQLDDLSDFRPTLALVGPGLTQPDGILTVQLPAQVGAIVVEPPDLGDSSEFFEPFTQTTYWQRQEIRLALPENGTYYLLVYDPQGDTGKYVLAVGEREEFGPVDLLAFPAAWWRIHWWFGEGLYLVLGTCAAAAAAVVSVCIVWRRRTS